MNSSLIHSVESRDSKKNPPYNFLLRSQFTTWLWIWPRSKEISLFSHYSNLLKSFEFTFLRFRKKLFRPFDKSISIGRSLILFRLWKKIQRILDMCHSDNCCLSCAKKFTLKFWRARHKSRNKWYYFFRYP